MKDKKVGLKSYEVLLCIVGISLLFTLIAAPPLLRTFLPAEEERPTTSPTPGGSTGPSPSPEADYVVLSCKKEEFDENGYSNINTKNILHQDVKIKRLETTIEEKFILVNDINRPTYEKSKDACENIPASYRTIAGYTRTCTSSTESGESFTMKETFDLSKFTETTIIDNEGNSLLVSSDALLDADYTVLQKELERDAYICQ